MSACNVGELGSIPGLGRSPGEGHKNPPQYSCLENPQGQKSLEGYSLWGCKELDVTERLHFHFYSYDLKLVLILCWEGLGARGEGDDRG